MNKTAMLKITNLILFISMLLQALTGTWLIFRFFTDKPKIFMGIVKFHEYNGIALVVLVIIHLTLNWGWIKAQFLKIHNQ